MARRLKLKLTREMKQRHLAWEACDNVRDLGGYATADGGQTRWKALVRSDSLCKLTPAGCASLSVYGIRTIIDLRSPGELALAPHPFAIAKAASDAPSYLNLPLLDEQNSEGMAALNQGETVEDGYYVMLAHFKPQVKEILQAVARAPAGGVLIHCHAGKDRTGLIVALLLAVAGVPPELIIQDYATSDYYLQTAYKIMLQNGPQDPAEKVRLARLLIAPPAAMLATLAHLNHEYGGVETYLRSAGVAAEDLKAIRSRLRA